MRTILAFIIAISLVSPGRAADVILREQATLEGSIVRLGDIADLSAVDPALVEELAAVPLLPAPAAGTPLFLSATQVRDLLAASNVDVNSLEFHGADAVAIRLGPASPAAAPQDEPILPDREAAVGRVAAAVVRYLHEQTGHELWTVQVDADAAVAELYWQSGPQLTVAGGKEPYTGRQSFQISDATGARVVSGAYAKVQRLEMVVVATRVIAAGDFVRATDVALRPYAGVVSAQVVRSVESVIGKEAVQNIRPNAMLVETQVRAPLLVRRGERVSVHARAAGIVVRTFAVAQQNGALGDLVQVQSLEGKDRYAARVAGVRELEVFAAGSSAGEVAAAAQ